MRDCSIGAGNGDSVGGGFELGDCIPDRIADVGFAYHSEVVFVVANGNNGFGFVTEKGLHLADASPLPGIGRKNFKPGIPAFVKAEYAAVFGFKPLPQPMTVFGCIKGYNRLIDITSVRNFGIMRV